MFRFCLVISFFLFKRKSIYLIFDAQKKRFWNCIICMTIADKFYHYNTFSFNSDNEEMWRCVVWVFEWEISDTIQFVLNQIIAEYYHVSPFKYNVYSLQFSNTPITVFISIVIVTTNWNWTLASKHQICKCVLIGILIFMFKYIPFMGNKCKQLMQWQYQSE